MEKQFILWDRNDARDPGYNGPSFSEDGTEIITSGVLGRVGINNVYLTTYAEYPGDERPCDLAVNERIKDVHFSLCGGSTVVDIWRVR